MDAINFNQHPIGLNSISNSQIAHTKDISTGGCFEADDSWSSNAADAISEAFSNMDDFLASYQESRIRPN